jgi:carbamoyltransferase
MPMLRIDAIDTAGFAEFRAVLAAHRYRGDAIFARTREWPKSYRAGTTMEAAYDYLFASEPAVRELLKLFLSRQTLEGSAVEALLTPPVTSFLVDIDLLERQADGYRCRYLLFPIEHAYIVTDPIGDFFAPGDRNAVFELVGEQSLLANALLREPCDTALDVCTGSGVFAILAARFCSHVWAVDINPRAVRFAKFNALLNGADNVTVLDSDVYSGLDNLTFDVITANPPYNPTCGAVETPRLSVHGGFGGEEVLFAILAGLRQHLRPGGRAQIITRLFFEGHAPYQHRLNDILDLDCFDAVLLHWPIRQIFTLTNLMASSWSLGRHGVGLAAMCDYYKSRGIERESFGVLNLRRVAAGGVFRTIERHEIAQDRSLVETIRAQLMACDHMSASDRHANLDDRQARHSRSA